LEKIVFYALASLKPEREVVVVGSGPTRESATLEGIRRVSYEEEKRHIQVLSIREMRRRFEYFKLNEMLAQYRLLCSYEGFLFDRYDPFPAGDFPREERPLS